MNAARPFSAGLLVLAMVGAAFALGIGVMGLLDDAGTAGASRDGRGAIDVAATGATAGRDSRFGIVEEVYDILERDFVEPAEVQAERARTAAINGIIQNLNDPHTVYLDAETYRLSSEEIGGEFEGIGATVNLQGDQIVIAQTFRGSPAEEAGMRPGDVILEVDGESTQGWSLQFAVARIRGERGTTVEIRVEHRNEEQELLSIVRDRIVVPSVQSLQIQDRTGNPVTDIAYLVITQFTDRTREELREFLEDVHRQGLTKLILDLRGNPGGLLQATVDTTGEFIDQGLILTQVNRDGSEEDFEDSTGGDGLGLDIAVLVNGNSASGSEVMAAALRDHGRAFVIGEQTLGKGTVNIPRRLSDGSVLYVSVARWITPNGDQIEGIGVIPDMIVTPSDSDFEQRLDVQLYAAIEYLRGGATATTPADESNPAQAAG